MSKYSSCDSVQTYTIPHKCSYLNNTIKNNSFNTSKGKSAYLYFSSNNTLTNNTVNSSSSFAIQLENSTNNTITLNISDVDGDPLMLQNVVSQNGTVSINPDNTLSYTPNV